VVDLAQEPLQPLEEVLDSDLPRLALERAPQREPPVSANAPPELDLAPEPPLEQLLEEDLDRDLLALLDSALEPPLALPALLDLEPDPPPLVSEQNPLALPDSALEPPHLALDLAQELLRLNNLCSRLVRLDLGLEQALQSSELEQPRSAITHSAQPPPTSLEMVLRLEDLVRDPLEDSELEQRLDMEPELRREDSELEVLVPLLSNDLLLDMVLRYVLYICARFSPHSL
jgi:hypothetical protein